MQPSYLPWAGYFKLMAGVDTFVFLDDAQLQKHSWHTRNRILNNRRVQWLTIPVRHNSLQQSIMDTTTCEEQKWPQKHVKTLRHAYSKSKYWKDIEELSNIIPTMSDKNLSLINTSLIKHIAKRLGLDLLFKMSSDLDANGTRTSKVINILELLSATEYHSPKGAEDYLVEDGFERQTNIKIKYIDGYIEQYPQLGISESTPNLSIVDIIANVGWEGAARYIRVENI